MDISTIVREEFKTHSDATRAYLASVAGTGISEKDFAKGYARVSTQKIKPSKRATSGKRMYRRAQMFGLF